MCYRAKKKYKKKRWILLRNMKMKVIRVENEYKLSSSFVSFQLNIETKITLISSRNRNEKPEALDQWMDITCCHHAYMFFFVYKKMSSKTSERKMGKKKKERNIKLSTYYLIRIVSSNLKINKIYIIHS